MATIPTPTASDIVIDLTTPSDIAGFAGSTALLEPAPVAHRLSELVQALTGCSVERAELAVGDPTPIGPISGDDALRTMAAAMVRLRSRQPA